MSHSARSAWIETLPFPADDYFRGSHSARSAWIETLMCCFLMVTTIVALRKECVD